MSHTDDLPLVCRWSDNAVLKPGAWEPTPKAAPMKEDFTHVLADISWMTAGPLRRPCVSDKAETVLADCP